MQSTVTNPMLQLGDRGEKVKELQQLLLQRLFGIESHRGLLIDGIFGAATRHAVSDFQTLFFLKIDCIVGPKTWKALYAGTPVDMPVLRRGSQSDAVQTAQIALKALEYYTGEIDSNFGPLTETAVKAFQQKVGLRADGTIGTQTWNKLSAAYITHISS